MGEDNVQPASLSAYEKRSAVQRVIKGENPSQVATSLGISIQEVMAWVRKFESARQEALESPDLEHLAALRDKPIGHSAIGVSNAEMDYPELLKGVDPKYYESLTEEQRYDLVIKQAIAQEKVGYEKYAPKFFLPEDEDPFPDGRRAEEADMFIALEINRPLLILGGIVLGLAVGVAAAKFGIDLIWMPWWILGCGAAAAVVLILIGAR